MELILDVWVMPDCRQSQGTIRVEGAFDFGVWVSNALRGWVVDGICAGPYKLEELEDLVFKDIQLSAITALVEFSKIDWQQAYKHLAVKLEDIKLQ